MNPVIKTILVVASIGTAIQAEQKSMCPMNQNSMNMKCHGTMAMSDTGKPTDCTKKALSQQNTCPVMGGKIDSSLYVDYKGQRLYVCCTSCLATVKKDPEKYLNQLRSSGQSAAKVDSSSAKATMVAQKTCPVMGNPIDTKVYTDYQGKRVYFCCPGCIATFNKNPEKYLGILKDKGEMVN